MSIANVNPRLTKLVNTLGVTDTAELIQTAVPIITERRETLSRLLLAQDLEGAADCAHKTLGSIRLYGTPNLEGLLKQVKTLDASQHDLVKFQQRLFEEFSQVIKDCNGLLGK